MIIYKVIEADYGSYEPSNVMYFETLDKAIQYCKKEGLYRKDSSFGDITMESPLIQKVFLKVGDFVLDVTKKWMDSEFYDDGDLWQLSCDYMLISEVSVA